MPCRIRDLGYGPGYYRPGKSNSVFDIAGLQVGQNEIHDEDKGIHVGVTIMYPRGVESTRRKPCYAAIFALNGGGEMTGSHFIHEWGFTNSPIAFTDSMSVGAVYQTLMTHAWAVSKSHKEDAETGYAHFGWPVVGETWGGGVTDIHDGKSTLTYDQVLTAIKDAELRTAVGEGGKGGGAGMLCLGHKGGTGSSSRVVPGNDGKEYTVAVLTQTNFGQRMTFQIGGVPIGKLLAREDHEKSLPDSTPTGFAERQKASDGRTTEGSILVATITDAPLLPHQLRRLAMRSAIGMAGAAGHGMAYNSSGDIFIALSTAEPGPEVRMKTPWTRPTLEQQGQMGSHAVEAGEISGNNFRRGVEAQQVETVVHGSIDALFTAASECVEEAILNSICAAEDTIGFDGTVFKALDADKVKGMLEKYGTWV